MSEHFHALVWIDHREAKVFHFNSNEVTKVIISSHSSVQPGNASGPSAINNRDEIVGAATNATPDPFADAVMSACHIDATSTCDTFAFSNMFSPTTTETHAVLWHDDSVRD